MANVTGIVLGILGKTLGDVTEMMSDGKVTLGEVFEIAFGVADGIGSAFPEWTKTAYRIGGANVTAARIMAGFGDGIPKILDGFGVRDWIIGKA